MSCLPGLGKVGGVVDDETESCNPPGLANVGLKTTTRNIAQINFRIALCCSYNELSYKVRADNTWT